MKKEKSDIVEGVNLVNRLATKGEKILLTIDKTRKNNYRLKNKKIHFDFPTTAKRRKL